jgi:hypothetical protein
VAQLAGVWDVERVSGLLPPLLGVRKVIRDGQGETKVGPLPGVPFDVRGLELHYRRPLSAFVDVLEADGDGYRGDATAFGRRYGRFRMRRVG